MSSDDVVMTDCRALTLSESLLSDLPLAYCHRLVTIKFDIFERNTVFETYHVYYELRR